ncbi:phosphatidylcholine-sterol acyltransferase [Callorhinchus milii]|uniref:Lecithin-cholesterol acyltransferase n=1 Tax=Callorhinchus milii TaxID=7868 RepID=A0A4W3IL57_CALMI|nr:phosphatidylcholine-sterol acyltransferase [Callorhinchus milii]|eukprot:gi/632978223/ref/XP_007905788.1/ PREDICTED: phosphatidylcholine-sterol acyltransferase [Callorhinchus milii]
MKDCLEARVALVLVLVALCVQDSDSSMFWFVNVFFPPVGPEDAKLNQSEGAPIVIVPGNIGNQLEGKLNKPSLVHWLCMKKTHDYVTLWLNLNTFMPIGIDCWIDNVRLVYNQTTRKSTNAPGVETRVPGFGKTFSVEHLDNIQLTGYLHTLVQSLVNLGYVRDETVRAAPYDWRFASIEQEEYFHKLKNLIEEMYTSYRKPVYLLGHSLGCLHLLHFLNNQPQAWKDKFIHGFISLGGLWGGAIKSLRVLASGDNYGVSLLPPMKVRIQQRTTTTNPWILPTKQAWPPEHIFISTPTYNYTYDDYRKFFSDIEYEDGWFKWQDSKELLSNLPAPGVEVYCVYGIGVPTPVTYIYDEHFPNAQPVGFLYEDGDNTVSTRSLSLCKGWKEQQKQKVHVIEYPGLQHLDIVYSNQTLTLIEDIVLGSYSESYSERQHEPSN